MGEFQHYGPLLVIDYITAPNVEGYQNGTLILGTTHIKEFRLVPLGLGAFEEP